MENSAPQEKGYQKLLAENRERLKELACINKTTAILKEGKSIEETIQKITLILPSAWQYPENTTARISYAEKQYKSARFKEAQWKQVQTFDSIDGTKGKIEIFYTKKYQKEFEGPFLKEERHLIDNLANLISGYINSYKAKQILEASRKKRGDQEVYSQAWRTESSSRKLLQKFLTRQNSNRDILHDLMPFKVKEILLVANLYDAFSIEREGRFADHILGEYHQLNLTSMPRITGVSSEEEALEQLSNKHFDLIIIMMGVDTKKPLRISQEVKKVYPYIPIFLLLNNSSVIELIEREPQTRLASIDKTFIWNGDSKVFFAMVKLLEDSVNIENDTEVGLSRVIVLVEDSARYYSRYLPMLYTIVLEQTRHLIDDVSTDELYRVLKLRARPKIILSSTYEEAFKIINKYRDYMLCLITDMRFPKSNMMDAEAGYHLIRDIKALMPNIPTVLQSSDPDNVKRAHQLKSVFINKNSDTLLQDLKSFINYYLGFGDFIYRNKEGQKIAIAKSMREFEDHLKTIPDESLIYHALKNHFSLWLMARGEIQTAKIINPLRLKDFKDIKEMRSFLIDMIQNHRSEQDKGKVVNFHENVVQDETNILSLAPGNLGGKGRGLAFVNTLIYNFNFNELLRTIKIKTPKTAIIGTDEFDLFLDTNNLHKVVHNETDYQLIRESFINGRLSYTLRKRLKIFLKYINKPLAIRSSSLFEDSLTQPFSGIFETYILPNNHPQPEERLRQVLNAIKLVYASIYSPNARTYFQAINNKLEEEKMAVVIQELVGSQYDNYYYPHISGTAQSHNYYPVAHMKPEEGFAVLALGLGQYVVEGEKAYRFSPSYPRLDVISPKDLFKSSQTYFYAVNLKDNNPHTLKGEDVALTRLDITESEKHGTLKHCASVYNPENDVIQPGLDTPGPRVVNFANVLKYDYIPLSHTLQTTLDVVKEAIGSPVEIEFAIDLNKDNFGQATFYLLQIKPLVGNEGSYNLTEEEINSNNALLVSTRSMGNGVIDNITDVIYVPPEKFKKSQTLEMTYEIEKFNKEMMNERRMYILIGPGRWGTRDKYIGIPVAWPQISNAKVIVEMSMKDFPLDASLGSHFFHNVTSMNVGYFSIQHHSHEEKINWDLLKEQEVIKEGEYFIHKRFSKPLKVIMDGKKRISVILHG